MIAILVLFAPRFNRATKSIDHPICLSSRRVAASRAIETTRQDALFSDPFAEHFAGSDIMAWIHSSSCNGTVRSGKISVRTKYFDDFCLDCSSEGVDQFVCVGCGMDSRSFRLPLIPSTSFYEVDCEPVLQYKENIIKKHGFVPRCHRRIQSVDLSCTADWTAKLSHFDIERKSAWMLEGVVMYVLASYSCMINDLCNVSTFLIGTSLSRTWSSCCVPFVPCAPLARASAYHT